MKWKVIYVFGPARQETVYAGNNGTLAMHVFGHWAVSGALRAEVLRDGELWDCRGLNSLHPLLQATGDEPIGVR